MTDKPIDTILAKLSGCRPSGDTGRQWAACCPAHGDAHQSLGIGVTGDGRVLLKCYAGCPVEDIVAAVGLTKRDLFPGRKEREVKKAGVTVTVLGWEKRLDPKFLRDECGLVDDTTCSAPQVLIQYRDRNGEVMFSRRRLAVRAKDGTRQPRGTKLRPYGLWKLQQAAETGVLIIPEGESDAWALWSAGYPALGLPGADAANALQADDLAGVTTVYVWRDKPQKPDDVSGQHFVARVHARVKELRPEARVLVLSDPEHKDPSELNQKFGPDFRKRMDERIAAAEDPAAVGLPLLPDPKPGKFDLSDDGNAARFVAKHGKDSRYCSRAAGWFVWTGMRWEPDTTGDVERRAKATAQAIYAEAADAKSPEERDAILRHASASRSVRSMLAMLRMAQCELPIDDAAFDADPWLLNCPNGTVDLRTGRLGPHRREDLLTRVCPVDYDPDARAPAWKAFLARVFAADPNDPNDAGDADLIGFVRRLFGYCLTGVTTEQILPVFWGGGSNGKTTVLNVIRDVMGLDYWTKAPRGMLMVRRNEEHSAELLTLKGTRLAVATETSQDAKLNEELIKELTGEDMIQARAMYQNFSRPFSPTCKLIMCTNHLPQIPEGGDGTWRRLRPVPFRTRFWDPYDPSSPTGPEHLRKNPAVVGKLQKELPGILADLVRGCLEWQREGLQLPDAVREAAETYRTDEDWVGLFLAECCDVEAAAVKDGVQADTPFRDVYARYVRWVERDGGRAKSNRKLKAGLLSHNVPVKAGTGNVVTCYRLRLIENEFVGEEFSESPLEAADRDYGRAVRKAAGNKEGAA